MYRIYTLNTFYVSLYTCIHKQCTLIENICCKIQVWNEYIEDQGTISKDAQVLLLYFARLYYYWQIFQFCKGFTITFFYFFFCFWEIRWKKSKSKIVWRQSKTCRVSFQMLNFRSRNLFLIITFGPIIIPSATVLWGFFFQKCSWKQDQIM